MSNKNQFEDAKFDDPYKADNSRVNQDGEGDIELPEFFNFRNTANNKQVRTIDPSRLQARQRRAQRKLPTREVQRETDSLFIFTERNVFRQLCQTIAQSEWFERFMLLTIVFNCVLLLADTDGKQDGNGFEMFSYYADLVFVGIYTIEAIIKIIAMGFALNGEHSYIREGWNLLDFVVVVYALIQKALQLDGGLNILRMFRFLRFLGLVKTIPAIQIMTDCVIYSIQQLFDAVILLALPLLLCALVALELYMGRLDKKCYNIDTGAEEVFESIIAPHTCVAADATSGRKCGTGYICALSVDNPFYGGVTFDHFGFAFLSLLQVVTLEGWTTISYLVQEGVGRIHVIFFVFIVYFLAYYVTNLVITLTAVRFDVRRKRMLSALFQQSPHLLDTSMVRRGSFMVSRSSLVLGRGNYKPSQGAVMEQQKKQLLPPIKFFDDIARSTFMETTVLTMVLLNVTLLCLNSDVPPAGVTDALSGLNQVIGWFFLFEQICKILGDGPANYFTSSSRWFELLLTGLAIAQFFLDIPIFAAFGVLRLVRVVDLMMFWRPAARMLTSITNSMSDQVPMAILVMFFIAIFAALGRQLFRGAADNFKESPLSRARWDNFWFSALSVFQLLTAEDWHLMMYDGIRAKGFFAVLYFVAIVFLGIFVITSTYIAILIGNITSKSSIVEIDKKDLRGFPLGIWKVKEAIKKLLRCPCIKRRSKGDDEDDFIDDLEERSKSKSKSKSKKSKGKSKKGADPTAEDQQNAGSSAYSKLNIVKIYGRSFGMFGPENLFRIYVARFFTSVVYSIIMSLIVAGSCIVLAMNTPDLDLKSTAGAAVNNYETILLILFILEWFMKNLAFGTYGHPGAYLTVGWNYLDIFCLLSTLGYVITVKVTDDHTAINAFRALLAFRALRLSTLWDSTREIVLQLFGTIPQFMNVTAVSSLIYFLFAIIGMQLFKGRLKRCLDRNGETIPVDRDVCTYFGGKWINPKWGSFDNLESSLRVLFEIAWGEDWQIYMWDVMDYDADNKSPKKFASPMASIFFVAYIATALFFIGSLYMAFVINRFLTKGSTAKGSDQYGQLRDRISASFLEVLNIQFPQRKTAVADAGLRFRVYLFVETSFWRRLSSTLIIANVGLIAANYKGMDDNTDYCLNWANNGLTFFFLIEIVLKLIAYGPLSFFNWLDLFDSFVILFQFSLFWVELFDSSWSLGVDTSILRVIRLTRILRLIFRNERLRETLHYLILSMPGFIRMSSLVIAMMFIYGVVGVIFFADVRYGRYINDVTNFKNVPSAMYAMFRALTGESWQGMMQDLSIQPPNCTPDVDCGDPQIAYGFFASFQLISACVLLNVFVIVLVRNLEAEAKKRDDYEFIVETKEYFNFVQSWAQFTRSNTVMNVTDFEKFMMSKVKPPLGYKPPENVPKDEVFIDFMEWCQDMRFPLIDMGKGYQVHFYDIICCLFVALWENERDFPEDMTAEEMLEQDALVTKRRSEYLLSYPEIRKRVEIDFYVCQALSVQEMQRRFRLRKKKQTAALHVNQIKQYAREMALKQRLRVSFVKQEPMQMAEAKLREADERKAEEVKRMKERTERIKRLKLRRWRKKKKKAQDDQAALRVVDTDESVSEGVHEDSPTDHDEDEDRNMDDDDPVAVKNENEYEERVTAIKSRWLQAQAGKKIAKDNDDEEDDDYDDADEVHTDDDEKTRKEKKERKVAKRKARQEELERKQEEMRKKQEEDELRQANTHPFGQTDSQSERAEESQVDDDTHTEESRRSSQSYVQVHNNPEHSSDGISINSGGDDDRSSVGDEDVQVEEEEEHKGDRRSWRRS